MSQKDVLRPGHVGVRVMDLDEAVRHYTGHVGLIETGRDREGRVYLKAWDEYDWFSLVLREADESGMDFMGFKVRDAGALARLERALAEFGCRVERIPAGELEHCGERVRFDSPTGHRFELYAEKDFYGNEVGTTNPEAFVDTVGGMAANRFDHCLLYGTDLDGSVRLFREVLGFDLAEQVVDGETLVGAFLSCSNKAHDVAFIRHDEPGRLHHVSFLLDSWEEVLRAADIMSKYGISIDIGPTRHGITRGKTIYFFDPSGNRNEVFAGGSTWYPDHPTITWTADSLGKAIFYHDRVLNENFLAVVT
ncbi:catechol 2,3-dioxygenase [Arhodomonas aquaeolei]|uniref:catechol 2,3-dioxygenase n=1 Tax=Arhodomonas aquaeolei TaxID=2369 RepID=UPI002166CF3A|nr:catechol 2,3-dioxygenase [Arhodomonas aquaeolei]MCS4502458.1 catechol 2,3-dioxygenase [Arhodomonas aquaeolei]